MILGKINWLKMEKFYSFHGNIIQKMYLFFCLKEELIMKESISMEFLSIIEQEKMVGKRTQGFIRQMHHQKIMLKCGLCASAGSSAGSGFVAAMFWALAFAISSG